MSSSDKSGKVILTFLLSSLTSYTHYLVDFTCRFESGCLLCKNVLDAFVTFPEMGRDVKIDTFFLNIVYFAQSREALHNREFLATHN